MFALAPRLSRPARDWVRAPLVWLVAPVAAFVAAFCIHLWPEWSRNPDLSHGFFAPLIFALLVWEGTRTGPARWLKQSHLRTFALVAALLGALAMLALAGLLAASVGWHHAVVDFCLAAALAAALGAALLVLADERVRAVPFNWTVLTAIGLWLFAAPLPTGTYAKLTLALQGSVTAAVLNALHLLGIPARQAGNIIELATTSVGVEEACSGIRSLISCVYAGFFFAAWLLRTPGKRLALILAAPLLAIAMNFVRSLALTLMANAGHEILGFWHDATGYAILGLTAGALALLATLLGGNEPPTTSPTAAGASVVPRVHLALFGSGLAAGAALLLFFAVASRPGDTRTASNIPVERLLPTDAPGWIALAPRDDFARFTGILQTEHLVERTYVRQDRNRAPIQLNVYIAHWAAGAAPVSLVASHTPDACWPGTGWIAEPTPDRQVALPVGDATLPVAEHRVFAQGGQPQHVWFWHIYDGRVINYRDPYSIPALIEIALRYGFRREGSQYFVRVSSNAPWDALANDPLVRELFANLAPTGLRP